MLSQSGAIGLAHEFFPDFLEQRKKVRLIDLWMQGKQYELTNEDDLTGRVYVPEGATKELENLGKLAPNAFASLLVKELVQTANVEGVRLPGVEENMASWDVWQENRWDAKQIALHTGSVGHGMSFGVAAPAINRFSKKQSVLMSTVSAKRMAAWYDDDDDEWPLHALKADQVISDKLHGFIGEWTVQVYDEEGIYYLSCENNGREIKDWTFISAETHGAPVPPVVRYPGSLDLDGNAMGVIEPVLPMLRRIDQTTYDRLIVQRFGAWKVRWIAGLAKPSDEQMANMQALELSMMDILLSSNPDTKFGTLDSSSTGDYISGADTDLRYLAAITQTPPHHLLGLSDNLQAEALETAEKGLQRKSLDFKTLAGESHEQMFRLIAMMMGNTKEATATGMKVRWRDTEARSLVQTSNALTLLASGLGIPSEMLWEKLPGWDDADSIRAKKLIESGGVDQLLAEIAANQAIEVAKATKPAVSDNGGKGGSDNAPKK